MKEIILFYGSEHELRWAPVPSVAEAEPHYADDGFIAAG